MLIKIHTQSTQSQIFEDDLKEVDDDHSEPQNYGRWHQTIYDEE